MIIENQSVFVQQGGGSEGERVSFMRIRMFRTTAEAKGEDLDPVNMFKTPPPPKEIYY